MTENKTDQKKKTSVLMELPFELGERKHKPINKTYTASDKRCGEIACCKGGLGLLVMGGRAEI